MAGMRTSSGSSVGPIIEPSKGGTYTGPSIGLSTERWLKVNDAAARMAVEVAATAAVAAAAPIELSTLKEGVREAFREELYSGEVRGLARPEEHCDAPEVTPMPPTMPALLFLG